MNLTAKFALLFVMDLSCLFQVTCSLHSAIVLCASWIQEEHCPLLSLQALAVLVGRRKRRQKVCYLQHEVLNQWSVTFEVDRHLK